MCIRDSVDINVSQVSAYHGVREAMTRQQRRIGSRGAVVMAVSYTHLRAHETVLDLVCRLLLEKKTRD